MRKYRYYLYNKNGYYNFKENRNSMKEHKYSPDNMEYSILMKKYFIIEEF